MHFLSDGVQQILKSSSKNTIKFNLSYVTFSMIYYSAVKNEKIKELLNAAGVDTKVLESSLYDVIVDKSNNNEKAGDGKSEVLFSEFVNSFIHSCSKHYAERLEYFKNNKIDVSLAKVDEAMFLSGLMLELHNYSPKDGSIHIIYDLTLKASKETSLMNLISKVVGVCTKKIDESLEGIIPEEATMNVEDSYATAPESSKSLKNEYLNDYTINMNKEFSLGNLDENVIGREDEVSEMFEVLSRKKKSNPILVGESGVGKTSIVDLLVCKIMKKEAPKSLEGKIIYNLNLTKLVSGTKYRGDFELRMEGLISDLKNEKNAILFIDEIHMVFNAGSTSSNGLDVSGILKPYLANGSIKCIGATTSEEYSQIFEKNAALSRRFQKIKVEEPKIEDMFEILSLSKVIYEKHHKVKYKDDVIKSIINLTNRYMHNLRFPDKAIDILDQTGSIYSSGKKKGKEVTVDDVVNVISKRTGIKLDNDKEELDNILNLEKNMKSQVFGQDKAIESLVEAVYIAKSGLNNQEKPYASFLFLGPTGVGKTEVAKVLENSLKIKLHRLDMSEYSQEFSVSNLFGSPSGYVGSDKGGLFTELVSKDPYSIVLLDEIEKAHPKVFDAFLQVLDNGFMTDSLGKKVSFRNTIIIMTSNVGVKVSENKNVMGFGGLTKEVDLNFKVNEMELNKTFSPEFRNRLSGIVSFNYLSEEIVIKVVDKFLLKLKKTLSEKNITLNVSFGAKKLLAKDGFDRKMGARPMERIINEKIKKPLSKEILFGKLQNGGLINVKLKKGELVLEY